MSKILEYEFKAFKDKAKFAKFIDAIVESHEYFKSEHEISSISLRDVARFH